MPKRRSPDPDAWRKLLDALHARYHRPEFIGTDPVAFVHRFCDPRDQEITGLIASSLAYGNVTSINRSIEQVLSRMQHRPRAFLAEHDLRAIGMVMKGFRHRWTSDQAITGLLGGMKCVIENFQSLGDAFYLVDQPEGDITGSLSRWVDLLRGNRTPLKKELLAEPGRRSACKRLHLYLRWMIRRDVIDPGPWHGIHPSRLMMPLDTHIFAWARHAGITRRTSADARTVEEITAFMRRVDPQDPVRYDFSLTRPGIIDGVIA